MTGWANPKSLSMIEIEPPGQWLDPKLRAGAEESFAREMLDAIRDELTEIDPSEAIVRLWNRHEMGSTIREVPECDQPLVDELVSIKADLATKEAELVDLKVELQNLRNQHYALRRACESSKAAKIVQALNCLPERRCY